MREQGKICHILGVTVKTSIRVEKCLIMLTLWGGAICGQRPISAEALFEKLQSERTSRAAYEQFLKTGKRHSDLRKYLTDRLPEKIAAGPGDHPTVWENDVLLAGHLRIVEAIPALVQQLDQRIPQDLSGLSNEELLRDFPAGAALGELGEPAIPALSSVLETSGYQKRWVAIRALNLIGARAATEALSRHLPSESDPKLKDYMERIVQRRRAGLPH